MRDEKRIKRILGEIESTWNKHPDMRFFQLCINMGLVADEFHLWNFEDDKLEEFLTHHGLSEKKTVKKTNK